MGKKQALSARDALWRVSSKALTEQLLQSGCSLHIGWVVLEFSRWLQECQVPNHILLFHMRHLNSKGNRNPSSGSTFWCLGYLLALVRHPRLKRLHLAVLLRPPKECALERSNSQQNLSHLHCFLCRALFLRHPCCFKEILCRLGP